MNDKNKIEAIDVLNNLNLFVYGDPNELDNLTKDEIRKELKLYDIDPAEMVKKIKLDVKKIIGEKRRKDAKENREFLMSKLFSLKNKLSDKTSEKLKRLIEFNPNQAILQFRKFEEAKEEDIPRLAQDLLLLEEIVNENDEQSK